MTALTVIETLPLSNAEYLRVSIHERRDSAVIDVRIFTSLTEVDGIQTSTGRGVTADLGVIGDLMEALRRAQDEAERRGLI